MEVPTFIKNWERELGQRGKNQEIGKILKLVHGSSVNTRMMEINYKCLTRWYRTPDIVGKFQKGLTIECWRGCNQIGSMAHIWWSCLKIKTYWKEILRYIKMITSIELPEDPWICLFHGVDIPMKEYRNSLIPKKWKEVDSPKIGEWFAKN